MYIFTDGSVLLNGKKNAMGGIAVYIPKQNNIEEFNLTYSLITNNQFKVTNQIAELIAAIIGIAYALEHYNEDIYVYTDSKYVINSATVWYKKWIENKWQKDNKKLIDNLWLIYPLIQLVHNKKNPIFLKHIKAHMQPPSNSIKSTSSLEHILWQGNNIADKLAYGAAEGILNVNTECKILNWQTFAILLLHTIKNNMNGEIPFIKEISEFYKSSILTI